MGQRWWDCACDNSSVVWAVAAALLRDSAVFTVSRDAPLWELFLEFIIDGVLSKPKQKP